MTITRMPAVADLFYPDNSVALQQNVENYVKVAKFKNISPRALIAPHAGYIYSGEIAGSGYKQLDKIKYNIKRVVLLGPSHRIPFAGLALSHADFFHTPLGDIPLDKEAILKLSKFPQVHYLDVAHKDEHSLEVHLPFLQVILNNFSLIPIVVGDADAKSVMEVLEFMWNDPQTFVVISSDLSHYHSYDEAQKLDAETTRSIEDLDFENINSQDACGKNPINGLLKLAKKYQLKITTLDVRNSGDTAGDKNRVVGYGAYAICES